MIPNESKVIFYARSLKEMFDLFPSRRIENEVSQNCNVELKFNIKILVNFTKV